MKSIADVVSYVPGVTSHQGENNRDQLVIRLSEKIKLQAHIENLLNEKFYLNADGNNNISPGAPRSLRLAMIARF